MTHLMSHGYMGDCRGDMLAIVHQGDDAGVQALETTAIVLENTNDLVCCVRKIAINDAFLILGNDGRIDD